MTTLLLMSRRNRFYPHLLEPDIDLWLRFLDKYEDKYTTFDYDVRIGHGRDPGNSFSPVMRNMGIELSQRRIDVVAYKENEIEIIEITVSAGLKCIGQLETYPILYKSTYKPFLPVTTLLLAEKLEADIEPILKERNYNYIVIPKP